MNRWSSTIKENARRDDVQARSIHWREETSLKSEKPQMLISSAVPFPLTQETDKATMDVEAQDDGIMAKILVSAR